MTGIIVEPAQAEVAGVTYVTPKSRAEMAVI
jgi:hypothetical protein